MPLQSRVDPFGHLFASPARGLMMGNRGGRIHDGGRQLGARRWASKQWICCVLDFKDRRRKVWGDSYTELFFLDEVTALAAGHRPCFECRRRDAERFAELFVSVSPTSVHSRASGNPALGPRFRGDERVGMRASATFMDTLLHKERLDGRAKRRHRAVLDRLPDGAMIARDGEAFAVRGKHLLHWTPAGYDRASPRPRGTDADVLTPPSVVEVLRRGYTPLWHPSAAL
jgi:hypothetical protein